METQTPKPTKPITLKKVLNKLTFSTEDNIAYMTKVIGEAKQILNGPIYIDRDIRENLTHSVEEVEEAIKHLHNASKSATLCKPQPKEKKGGEK